MYSNAQNGQTENNNALFFVGYSGVAKFAVFLFLINAYFVSIIPASGRQWTAIFTMAVIFAYGMLNRKLSVDGYKLIWVLPFFVMLISIYSTHENYSYVVLFSAFIFMLIFMKQDISWMRFGCNIMLFGGLFYSFFTILPLVSRTAYTRFVYPFLLENNTFDVLSYLDAGTISGFTYQAAVNAQYLSIGIGAMIIFVLMNSETTDWKKLIGLVFLILEVVSLVFAQKRSFLIFSLMSLLVVIYVSGERGKRFRSFFFAFMGIMLLAMVLYFSVPAFGTLIDRFLDPTNGDISNGRFVRYEFAWELFKDNKLFGVGWCQYRNLYVKVSDTHNIYLQLLCETGICGTFFFIVAFVYSIYKAIKKLTLVVQHSGYSIERRLLMFSVYVQILFLLYGLVGNGLYDYYIYYFYGFAVLIGFLCPIPGEFYAYGGVELESYGKN